MNAKTNLSQTANFIEEFAWFLQSKKNINLEEAAQILRDISSNGKINGSTPPTKANELVGILPFLFQDKDLFKHNKDIIDFAEDLLGISTPSHAKKTRYGLIGFIVTEATKLNKKELNKWINELSLISNDVEKLKEIKKAKKDINFSWNEAIANLNK